MAATLPGEAQVPADVAHDELTYQPELDQVEDREDHSEAAIPVASRNITGSLRLVTAACRNLR